MKKTTRAPRTTLDTLPSTTLPELADDALASVAGARRKGGDWTYTYPTDPDGLILIDD